jgi:hypothetical protein
MQSAKQEESVKQTKLSHSPLVMAHLPQELTLQLPTLTQVFKLLSQEVHLVIKSDTM